MTKVYQKNLVTFSINLDIKEPQVSHVSEDSDPIDIALHKYVGHPSILKIEECFNEPIKFNFPDQKVLKKK